jgi:5,10-methylene-tetrahydrofolate dehydrogenase/methenyl tetrahydrofolate cyclohydrolase
VLATYGGYVHTFNDHSNQKRMREICQESDIIVATTGKLHLVDESFIRQDQSQVIIDVGR